MSWVKPPPRVKEYTGAAPSSPRAPALRIADTRARLTVPIPKGEKTKPGKRTPTKAEREWMDWIVAYGCIACRMDGHGVVPPAVHHILSGGRRMGHLFTLPLCDPGHHQNGDARGLVSRHPWKKRFEQRYGVELFLLRDIKVAYYAATLKEKA